MPVTAILGAGLTGMSAAYHLGEAGAEVRLFEQRSYAGGHVVTREEQGYRFDVTGHFLHLRDPKTKELALSWIDDEVLTVERQSRVFSNGVYTRYPFQANTFGLPPDVAYECVMGFVAARLAKHEKPPANFEEFCLQHFGEGMTKHFMVPYNARLWGVSPTEITAEWCQRFVPLPKLEDVIAGAVGKNDKELGYNATFLYPKRGIGALSAGLAKRVNVELGKKPRAIDWKRKTIRFDGEDVRYDALISSAPLPVLISLLDDAPEAVRAAAKKLRATHLHYLDVALNTEIQKPFHWIYVPEAKYPFYRVGCFSNVSRAMAPPGKSSLFVELADRGEPDMAKLLPRVADAFVEMGLIDHPHAIKFARPRKIDFAYVIFDHDYFASTNVVREFLAEIGIVSAGRYGGWNYSSMEDALHFGRDAAKKVLGEP